MLASEGNQQCQQKDHQRRVTKMLVRPGSKEAMTRLKRLSEIEEPARQKNERMSDGGKKGVSS